MSASLFDTTPKTSPQKGSIVAVMFFSLAHRRNFFWHLRPVLSLPVHQRTAMKSDILPPQKEKRRKNRN